MKKNVLKYSVVLLILFFIFMTVSVNAEIVSEGVCGENLTWTLDNNGTLTINGTGDMTDYRSSEVPWKSSRQNITSIIINNGVTSIGQAAFFDCDGLVSVKIPEGVIKIGRSAFLKCDNLSDIEISDSVTCMGALAFGRTAYYNDISNWENGVLYLGNYLLEADWLIEGECSIKQGTKCIGEEAFSERENLTGVIIPDSVLYIGDWAFQVCSNLKNVEMGNNIETIGVGLFNACRSLTNIEFGKNIMFIDKYAFLNCINLENVVIPKYMSEIEVGAFENCNNIKTVKYKGNEKEWSEVYVGGNNGTLMTADIEYDYDTTVKTSCDVEIINNIVIVTPENVPDGCDIIFACYKDNIMIDMDCFTYQGTTIVPFATSCKYDKIKVMIWNNIKDMQPLCNIKCIEQL